MPELHAPNLAQILRLEVPIVVRVGDRPMRVRDVVGLAPGSIIELDKSSDEALDFLVNNKLVGRGEAVKVGENFGIRLTRLGEEGELLDALGDPSP